MNRIILRLIGVHIRCKTVSRPSFYAERAKKASQSLDLFDGETNATERGAPT
jgi:hypothetical protein